METTKSLKIFMLHAAMMMVGYISIRYSLALFLSQNHLSINQSYTIVTSAFALQVLCGFFWGFILTKIPSPDHAKLVVIGGFMSTVGIFILSMLYYFESAILAGISLYVVGVSLYLVNFQALTNAHSNNDKTRTYFNQKIALYLNSGALCGLLIGAWLSSLLEQLFPSAEYPVLYLLSIISILFSLRLIDTNKDSLIQISCSLQKSSLKSTWWMPVVTFFMVLIAFLLLTEASFARIIILASFLIFFAREFCFGKLGFHGALRLLTASIGNLCYTISIVVLFVSFGVFISHSGISEGWGSKLPSLFFYMFDPIANILMGTLIVKYLQRLLPSSSYILIGIFFLAIAFLLPMFSSLISNNFEHISAIAAVLVVMIFGTGEFFLVPALSSQISSLAKHPSDLRYYLGLMQLCSAAGLVIGYYVISLTTSTSSSAPSIGEIPLCAVQGCAFLAALVLMGIISLILIQRR